MTRHAHDPVTFDYLDCGEPWPCLPARERLTETMNRVDLGLHMSSRLYDAVTAKPGCPPSELFDRFVSWTRPPAPRPTVSEGGEAPPRPPTVDQDAHHIPSQLDPRHTRVIWVDTGSGPGYEIEVPTDP